MSGSLKYIGILVATVLSFTFLALLSPWHESEPRPDSLFMRDSLGKYDEPHVGLVPNDMVDNSMGRTVAYSTGDQDVREYKFMQRKFNRLQAILDSIQNGPTLSPEPPKSRERHLRPTEPLENCGKPGFPCPARPKPGQPFLSYTQRIVRMLTDIQERINAAAKRQYTLEDQVRNNWQQIPLSSPGNIVPNSKHLSLMHRVPLGLVSIPPGHSPSITALP